ncbi:hypothetical protein FPZ12_036955 [Amycolatopsis acidicola]|uniref:Uncharacterized protein n=1 Tax=Amycolatopsis acidicola TaxID=2596893 RepID=A0A5N0USC2_9PSEU|nr:hypothetical protein [Amycolatopsis acidicola]KAA9152404.1 hypothetical protein FPZ12_036955 [Amycolatopsis acidicola]
MTTGGFRAEPATLETVAGILEQAGNSVNSVEAPPDGPQAGLPTAAIAQVIANLSGQADVLVGGLFGAAAAVRDSRTAYEAGEQWATETLSGKGGGARAE